eukprot:7091060-Pyramimonas_sp.AAC.1
MLQGLHGLRAVPLQHVGSRLSIAHIHQRTIGFWIMRVQQLRWFAVLKSQESRSGTIQDRQDAPV